MKAARFDYARATTTDEAVKLLRQADGMGKALAGGQSLVPMMSLRLAQPQLIVDIRRIAELQSVTESDGHVTIGSLVTHAAIEDGEFADPAEDMLRHVASGIGYRGVRNRGTIGGSIAHADPSADWPAALLALGAVVEVAGPDGGREVAVDELLLGAFTTALEPDEVLTGIRVPRLQRGARWGYYKFTRKVGEFAESIGAVIVDHERSVYRVVLAGTGGAPLLLSDIAEELAAEGEDFAERFDAAAAASLLEAVALPVDEIDRRVHAAVLSRAVRRAYAQ